MVYNRLLKRLRDCNVNNFSEYLRMLEREPLHPEWQAFVNALTTNLTAFFREPHHFVTLADFVRSRKVAISIFGVRPLLPVKSLTPLR